MPTDPNIILRAGQGVTPVMTPAEQEAQGLKLQQMRQQTVLSGQQAQLQQAQLEDRNLINAQRAREQAGTEALAAAVKKHQQVDQTTGDVHIDYQGVATDLETAGFQNLASSWLKMQNENAEALDKLGAARSAHAKAQLATIGDLAYRAGSSDDFVTGVAIAAAHGLIPEDQARQIVGQVQAAGPEAWKSVAKHYSQFSPAFQTQQSEEAKPVTLGPGQNRVVNGQVVATGGPRPITAAELDSQAQALYAQRARGEKLTAEEAASLKAYEDRKTVVTDAAATAAANRAAAATERATTAADRRETFAMQQAGRKELTDKYEIPYQTALSSAQTLRDVVTEAKAGNKIAGALQSLETTMAAIRAQGLNRINTTELHNTAAAGSLYDRLVGGIRKLATGDPLSPALQQDMLDFAEGLQKEAYKKYLEGHKSITMRYKLTDEVPKPPPNAPEKGTERTVAGKAGVWDYRNGQWGWWPK